MNRSSNKDQFPNPRPMWLASVAGTGVTPESENIHGAFRGTFDLEYKDRVRIRLLAAHWYHAHIDGEFLAEGPPRFHPDHPEYEVFDLELPAGHHVLTIQAHAQRVALQTLLANEIPPFVLADIAHDDAPINISWKCKHLEAWERSGIRRSGLQGWVEQYNANKNIEGWHLADFDDTPWESPVAVDPFWKTLSLADIAPVGVGEITPGLMDEGMMAGQFRYLLDDIAIGFYGRDQDASPETATGRWYRFDLGRVRLGRPKLRIKAPKDAMIEVGISEALLRGRVLPWVYLSNSSSVWVDRHISRGGEHVYETFVPRGGRFLEVHIEGPPAEVELLQCQYMQRGYFGGPPADFLSGDDKLDTIWNAGVETLRACAEDAIVDTPVRERGQWTGDTLSVGLELVTTLYEDHRLIARAMRQIAQCAREDGLLPALTPGANRVCLLSYAAVWHEAAWNYYLRTGQTAHLHELLEPARASLRFFSNLLTEDGFTPGKELTFIDWGYIRGWDGVDLATHLFLRRGLRASISWFQFLNLPEDVKDCKDLLQRLDTFLEREIGAESPKELGYHITALAYTEGLLPHLERAFVVDYLKSHIMSCFPNNPDGPRLSSPAVSNPNIMTPYFSHFVFPILIENGEMDFVLQQIRHCWGWSLSEGRTTLTEVFDTHWTHSHHWSACPTWILSQHCLGLRPAFHLGRNHWEFVFEPGTLEGCTGKFPGGVHVQWKRSATGVEWMCSSPDPIAIHDTKGLLGETVLEGEKEIRLKLENV
ncbi:MAG: hypothetical protein JJU11_09700 [Candidatus Sumerlaeia bacterium]|nr:hypothetical protein [Candidatus Sumerlaeia bacterium]